MNNLNTISDIASAIDTGDAGYIYLADGGFVNVDLSNGDSIGERIADILNVDLSVVTDAAVILPF